MVDIILAILTVLSLVFGVFFMVVAAVGIVRMPDLYHRMHAGTKGVTLGITFLLIAGALAAAMLPDAEPVNVITKFMLVILFQFIANPVGAHLLAKAAHIDKVERWEQTIDDELEQDV